MSFFSFKFCFIVVRTLIYFLDEESEVVIYVSSYTLSNSKANQCILASIRNQPHLKRFYFSLLFSSCVENSVTSCQIDLRNASTNFKNKQKNKLKLYFWIHATFLSLHNICVMCYLDVDGILPSFPYEKCWALYLFLCLFTHCNWIVCSYRYFAAIAWRLENFDLT